MSLDDLKPLAAADPALARRLAAVQSLAELEAIAAEHGISIDTADLDDQELSSSELTTVSGGIGMLLKTKFGFGPLASSEGDSTDGCPTWDLDKCTVSTKKGESPSCG